MPRVRIGTCSSPADAALVRSVFEAHDIHVAIGAEHHASLLGGLGGAFLQLDISVDEADAEEAVALLAEIRSGEAAGEPEPVDEEEEAEVDRMIDRRRKTGVALLLGCCVTFGTAHMYSGAWLRGIALAGAEVAGLRYVAGLTHRPIGGLLVVGAVVVDLVGALWRIRATNRPTLPTARVRR